MGLSFVCPNCRKRVDPMSINATMSPATKLWQHRDCGAAESDGKGKDPEPPQAERRKQPRGNR